jgi:hypothetical protein
MSFPNFPGLTLPNMPAIPNPFAGSRTNQNNDKSFELVKYVTEREMYEYQYPCYNITIGYITTKYVPDIKDTGCYLIMINSQISEGPNAVFCLSRSDKMKKGNVNILVSSDGKVGDKLDIVWNPMEHPCVLLKHNFSKKQILKDDTKLRFGYDVRVISP